MNLSLARFTSIFIGFLFLCLGLLGFAPALQSEYSGNNLLFNFLANNQTLSSIYLLSGIAAILGLTVQLSARFYCQLFCLLYAFVAVVGMFFGTSVLNLFPINMAGDILHLGVAVILAVGGFVTPYSSKTALPERV